MPFQISPGVNVSEIDLSGIIPGVATTDAAFCATFQWGPVEQIIKLDKDTGLLDVFGPPAPPTKPNNDGQSKQWLAAQSFLAYSGGLQVVRVVGDNANNAAAATALLVKNLEDFTSKDDAGNLSNAGDFIAKYPGDLGNSLKVEVLTPTNFTTELVATATVNVAADAYLVTFTGNVANDILQVGDVLTFSKEGLDLGGKFTVVSFEGLTGAVVAPGFNSDLSTDWASDNITGITVTRQSPKASLFDAAPGTSDYVGQFGTGGNHSNDEVHIVVSDEDGAWTGTPGEILETFAFLSVASDAKNADGSANYFKDVINRSSKYIWATGTLLGGTEVGNSASANTTPRNYAAGYTTTISEFAVSLTGGVDDNDATPSDNKKARVTGYKLFADAEAVDVSLIFMGNADAPLIQNVIDNVALVRKDCIVFFSPQEDDTVNQGTNQSTPTTNVIAFRNEVGRSTSFAVMDSAHKLMYDQFNDVYTWVPLNADVAGLCAATELTNDAWWSPGGFNRGKIKNCVRLSWNPRKTFRDELYKNNINPIVSFTGEGPVLYGDKTQLTKPSAFDRINVRRLFIVLEKAIARASRYLLFEFNDDFTRAQFRNMVEPFLSNIKARRGIYQFKVICDGTNNTGEVIDRNEFVGDIYIKPAKSINFIQLNFVAVKTGVSFTEVLLAQ